MDYGHPELSKNDNKLSLSIAMSYSKNKSSALPCGTPFLDHHSIHNIKSHFMMLLHIQDTKHVVDEP